MLLTPVGIDIAKSVFQVHHLDKNTRKTVSRQSGAPAQDFAHALLPYGFAPHTTTIGEVPFATKNGCLLNGLMAIRSRSNISSLLHPERRPSSSLCS